MRGVPLERGLQEPGVQLGNRQLQAGLRGTPVSRQLCQLLDQLCGAETSRPDPARFALRAPDCSSVTDPAGLVFSTTPPGVTGTNKRSVSAVDPPTHPSGGKPQEVGGGAVQRLSLSHRRPLPPSSQGQSLEFQVKPPYPSCTWHQKFANLSLVLLRCFKIWTTIAFI